MGQFKLLGSFSIEKDGELSEVMKSEIGCAILIYLIVTRESQSRERVADLIWDAGSTKAALHNLRQLLSKFLRGKVGELQIDRKNLTFTPSEETFVDLYALEAGLSSGDPKQMGAAIKQYDGELLADFYLNDAPRFNKWLTVTRETLRLQVSAQFQQVCAAYEAQQLWAEGIDLLQHWLRLNPLDEAAHRQLMAFLAADGQIEAALQQFAVCQQLLREELDVEPDKETQRLAAEIEGMSQPAAGQLAEPGPLPQSAHMPFHRNKTFTGRRESLYWLSELLLSAPDRQRIPRAAVVSGMGGIGKTQLAVEYAYRYGRFYPGGVYWISFADKARVPEEVAAIGGQDGMGLFEAKSTLPLEEKIKQIRRAWREPTERLLIFDNCDNDLLAADWIPVSGGCSVLITSRLAVWPRELPIAHHPLPVLDRDESVSLIRKLAQDLQPDDAADIALTLGDLPLALQLAGHYLARHSDVRPQTFLTQLKGEHNLLHASLQGEFSRYSPTGHELSVARTFEISLERLDLSQQVDQAARDLLERAAWFAPGEPIPQTILIDSLVSDGSAEHDPSQHLLAGDGLNRLFSLGFLNPAGDDHVVMHRLLVTYVKEVLGEQAAALIDVERAVVEAHRTILRLEGALYEPAVSLLQLRHLTNIPRQPISKYGAELIYQLGAHLQNIADFEGAQTILEQALSVTREVLGEKDPAIIKTLDTLALNYSRSGAYREAIDMLEQVMKLHQQSENMNKLMLGQTLNNLGYMYLITGNYQKAYQFLSSDVEMQEESFGSDHPRFATVLNNIGITLYHLDRLEEAEELLTRSLVIREEKLGSEHPFTAYTLQYIGLLQLKQGNVDQARSYLEQAKTIRVDILGLNHPYTARSYNALGTLSLTQGDLEEARKQFEQALAIQKEVLKEGHPETALSFRNLGELYWTSGSIDKAKTYYGQALAVLETFAVAEHPDFEHIHGRLQNMA
ncbi:MAG: tetratricopeptide repeat protein [Chloroflexota bacterium]